MDPVFVAAASTALVIVYVMYRRYTRISLAGIPGPESASWIMGNTKELYQGQAGEADSKWQAQYGNIVRFKGLFGEDQLMISDPAALQYIFVRAGYRFPKPYEICVLAQIIGGKGIAWVDGDDHKRSEGCCCLHLADQSPKPSCRCSRGYAESMSNKWMDIISSSKEQSAVLDVLSWLSRATLDAIGEAAFDIRFGAIDNDQTTLVRAFSGLMADVIGSPSNSQVFVQGVARYIPPWVPKYIANISKNPRLTRMCEARDMAASVAKQMVQEKGEMLLQGKCKRDVFSLLVKANMDADAKAKLTEEELLAQMSTLLFAGHETTSNCVSFGLLELARYPEIQIRFREEIRATEAAIHARGDTEFTMADFENMTYGTAVLKEVLRFCCVVYHAQRCAAQDDVLPLSEPITKRSGEVIHELPIPKGTRIVASIAAYNRNKELWGDDAHIFNPERWLNGTTKEKKTTSLGVYANLMTFLAGVRVCIGWRFAVIEIQAFLTEIVGKFEFALTDKSALVRREPCLVMSPTVEGEVEKGVQLTLRVSVAPRTEKEY